MQTCAIQTNWRSGNVSLLPLLHVPSSKRSANGGVGHVPAVASFIHGRLPINLRIFAGLYSRFLPALRHADQLHG